VVSRSASVPFSPTPQSGMKSLRKRKEEEAGCRKTAKRGEEENR